jgi:LacI family transcriptional regulator
MRADVEEQGQAATAVAPRRVNMRDVARAAGVSLTAVQLVAAGKPGWATIRGPVRLGHTRVGLLAGPRKYRSLVDRQEGYLDALTEYGIPVEQALMSPPTHHAGGQKGYQQMPHLLGLPQPPTAVVAISDKTAFGALEALKERGLRIPQDMALVSIDDVAESAHTMPPLTTVNVPRAEMGAEAVRRLLALLRQEAPRPTKTVLYTRLVVRASCGG